MSCDNYEAQLRAILSDMEAWDDGRPSSPDPVKRPRGKEKPTYFGYGLAFQPPSTPRLQKLRPPKTSPYKRKQKLVVSKRMRRKKRIEQRTSKIYSSTIDLSIRQESPMKKGVRPSTCGVDRDEESAAGLFERTSVWTLCQSNKKTQNRTETQAPAADAEPRDRGRSTTPVREGETTLPRQSRQSQWKRNAHGKDRRRPHAEPTEEEFFFLI